MQAVILCGGYGTRIRDVAQDIPKPMINIGTYPVLWHIMKYYACFGIKKFVLCLGYKSEVIKDYFLNYQTRKSNFTLNLKNNVITTHNSMADEEWEITFVETGLNTFTGGRVKRIQNFIQEETFLLTYGDGIGDINITQSIEFHQKHGKLLTVTGAHPPGRFGELTIKDEQVIGFNEKPQTVEGWISAGFFVCNKKIFSYLDDDPNLMLEQAPLENIVKDGQMMVYKHDNFWHPMDTSRDYQLLNTLWNNNAAPWKKW